MTLRCVIVDDDPAVLHAARDLLEAQDMAVVGVAGTGEEALSLMEELEPDVMLVDIDLGPENGFELARCLSEREKARTCIILMSMRDENDYAHLIATSPAIGFLPKSNLSATAIRRLIDRRGRR